MMISYLLEVRTLRTDQVCDQMIASCPLEVEASGIGKNRAFIRFRVETDGEARQVAEQVNRDISRDYLLSTGYGVHWRKVEDTRSLSRGLPNELPPGMVQ